jgi:NADPH:quinone reductase-like Zn-dependent oxidoreductase
MKALLLKAPRQLELSELPRPDLLDSQVRVRVDKVGVCGSDYSSIAGKLPFTRFPIVPGHEASGEVLEAGKHTGWKPGPCFRPRRSASLGLYGSSWSGVAQRCLRRGDGGGRLHAAEDS